MVYLWYGTKHEIHNGTLHVLHSTVVRFCIFFSLQCLHLRIVFISTGWWVMFVINFALLEGRPVDAFRTIFAPLLPISINLAANGIKKKMRGMSFFSFNCLYKIHEFTAAICNNLWKTRFHHLLLLRSTS